VSYDCKKCPGWCCTYEIIQITKKDVQRLADHFGISYRRAKRKFTRPDGRGMALKMQHHPHFKRICMNFDLKKKRCKVYEVRPEVCRGYPYGKTCGYYQFLVFERKHHGSKTLVAVT
jgi:Fe-S-cluster containining protein